MIALLILAFIIVNCHAFVPSSEKKFFPADAGGACIEGIGAEMGPPPTQATSSTPSSDWHRAWFLNGSCLYAIAGWLEGVEKLLRMDLPFALDRFEITPDLTNIRERGVPAIWPDAPRGRSMADVCSMGIPLSVAYILGAAPHQDQSIVQMSEWCDLYYGHTWSGGEWDQVPYVKNMRIEENTVDIIADTMGISCMNSAHRSSNAHHHFWLAPRGMYSSFHADTSDNVHVVIAGRKRWFLIHPSDVPYFDVRPQHEDGRLVLEQFENGSLAEFGRLRVAGGRILELDVVGGDALYIPAGWGHAVFNLEDTVALNTWSYGEPFVMRTLRASHEL